MCGTNTASCSGRSRYGTSTASDGLVTDAALDSCPILRARCRQFLKLPFLSRSALDCSTGPRSTQATQATEPQRSAEPCYMRLT